MSRNMGRMASDPNFEAKEYPSGFETCLNQLGAFKNPILGTWIVKIGQFGAEIALERPCKRNIEP